MSYINANPSSDRVRDFSGGRSWGRFVRRGCRVVVLTAVVAAGFFSAVTVAIAADRATEAAYQRKFNELKVDDIDGHMKLALWCREQKAYDLLRRECNHILGIDPNHTQARLLLELAQQRMAADGDDDQQDETKSDDAGERRTAAGVVMLTDEQVQKIRRQMLDLERPENVRVNFKNDVLNRFWEEAAAKQNLPRSERATFFRLSPARKAQEILRHVKFQGYNESLVDDVEILTDPLIMNEFATRVWPIIDSGCATAACHGGVKAEGIAFVTERSNSDATIYTNYMILHEYVKDDQFLINRDRPDESLILTYGRPPELVKSNQRHPTDISPVFLQTSISTYRRVLRWLTALAPPRPDYGFKLEYDK